MTLGRNEAKTVLRVCSACAGDYEDPDRSAPDEVGGDKEPDPELDPADGPDGRLISEASPFVRESGEVGNRRVS
jgi:hypothetical protein